MESWESLPVVAFVRPGAVPVDRIGRNNCPLKNTWYEVSAFVPPYFAMDFNLRFLPLPKLETGKRIITAHQGQWLLIYDLIFGFVCSVNTSSIYAFSLCILALPVPGGCQTVDASNDNILMLKNFIAELYAQEKELGRTRNYAETKVWLKMWVREVAAALNDAYGEQVLFDFQGGPRLGVPALASMQAWRKRIEPYKACLVVLLKKEEAALSCSEAKPNKDINATLEIIEKYLLSWTAIDRSDQVDPAYIQKLHDDSILALEKVLSPCEMAKLLELDPKTYTSRFVDGFNTSSVNAVEPFVVCTRGWVLQLGNLRASFSSITSRQIAQPGVVMADSIVTNNRRVFIIHGHDETNRLRLEKMIRKFDLEPVVMLDEVADGLSVFLDKFETLANGCAYAVALITKDDLVVKNEVQTWQGRPNAMFEIGWFCKHFNRKRIILLVQSGSAVWSDLQGVEYAGFDKDVTLTYEKLHQSFKAAGLTK